MGSLEKGPNEKATKPRGKKGATTKTAQQKEVTPEKQAMRTKG